MNIAVLSFVPLIYMAAFVMYLVKMIVGWPRAERLSFQIAAIGLTVHTAGIALRWVESYQLGIGHAPLSNLYESLVFFAWAMVLVGLSMEIRWRIWGLGAFVMPAATLCLAYASFAPDVQNRIQPLIPALKSNWLVVHVLSCFLGYAAFVIAAALAVLYLAGQTRGRFGWSPVQRGRFILMRQTIMIGFLLFSIGIATGAVWAFYAWGTYWSWDPKETWALITWLIFAAALHVRGKRDEQRLIVLTLIGLACVFFTYFGVNYLPGLHSYM
jgi:ABC-type transport system involved in cytochrome c biogenesis permease subunit